jgi:hypothetical protein
LKLGRYDNRSRSSQNDKGLCQRATDEDANGDSETMKMMVKIKINVGPDGDDRIRVLRSRD